MKLRNVYLCNLKIILIFCVVLGHALERDIYANHTVQIIYRALYLFHMPLFTFLSGLGMKTRGACLKQMRTALKSYFYAQGMVLLFVLIVQPESVSTYFLRPFWHLWYLLSLSCWCLLAGVLSEILQYVPTKRIKHWQAIFWVGTVALGLFCGCFTSIGRDFSLSRTIVFFPFFLAGVFWGQSIITFFPEHCKMIFLCLPIAVLFFFLCEKLPVSFLYHATGYRTFGMTALHGVSERLLCYITSVMWSICVLVLCPKSKKATTQMGCDTLMTYLLHPLFIYVLPYIPYALKNSLLVSLFIAIFATISISISTRWTRKIYILRF